uniref:Ig-like domain-containing protein n=1 Tax=Gopherus evgoodei TaxID=1825980 RepID=A0A8C4WTS5_9SAUR
VLSLLAGLMALFVLCFPGTRSQYVVTQEPSLLVSPGGTVKLSCRVSIVSDISSIYPYWIQQRGGGVPRLLIYDANVKDKGSGVLDRFTASKDTSTHTCFLTISRAQAEDDADYYCADWDGPANQYTVIQLHREEEQKSLSPTVTLHLEPTCVFLVPMRWPGGLAPGSL